MINTAQLRLGMKVEREHRDLYKLVKHCKQPCRITEKKFYSAIAKAHLRENKMYYTKLARARL